MVTNVTNVLPLQIPSSLYFTELFNACLKSRIIPPPAPPLHQNKNFQVRARDPDKIGKMADDKLKLVEKVGKHKFKINEGFVANMKVPCYFYSNPALEKLMFDEYRNSCSL